jgi:hypothetical protein
MIETPYGIAASFTFEMYDSTTGQLKTDVALASGDAKVLIDGAAGVNATTLPSVTNGQWVWSASAAELSGKSIVLQVKHAGYLDAVLRVATRSDARAKYPDPAQVHSTTVSGLSASGGTLGAGLPSATDAALAVELRNASGVPVAATGASIAGTAVTFTPPFSGTPSGVASIHVYAVPWSVPLASETIGLTSGAISGVASSVVGTLKADPEWDRVNEMAGTKMIVTYPPTLPGTGTAEYYAPDGVTIVRTDTLSFDAIGRVLQRVIS